MEMREEETGEQQLRLPFWDMAVTSSPPMYSEGEMVGVSAQMQRVFSLTRKMALSSSNVLITGESGTGKELVAVRIHKTSARGKRPFVAINCSAIPEHLLESELFGHKRGSFTGAQEARKGLFEEANGGTIFLDEIGDMPIALQSKLLRVIQERVITPVGENKSRPIDVRIISATHKDLPKLVGDNQFRLDLYYRLSVVPINLPPLRDRRGDIVMLAELLLRKICERNGCSQKRFSSMAMAKLHRQAWPGNVRELENAIERAVALSEHMVIEENEIGDCPWESTVESPTQRAAFELERGVQESQEELPVFSKLWTMDELEKAYIHYVLTHTSDQKDKAAKILGINRKTLYRKEVSYGLARTV